MIDFTTNPIDVSSSKPLLFDENQRKIFFESYILNSFQELQMFDSSDFIKLQENEVQDVRVIIKIFREKYPEYFI